MKKYLMALCAIVIIFSQGGTAFALNNNTMSSADEVTIINYDPKEVSGYVGPDDLVDWYKINPSVCGICNFQIYMPTSDSSVDYTFSLYSESGELIATGIKIGGTNKLSLSPSNYIRKRPYYVKVEFKSGSHGLFYTLILDLIH